MYLSEGRWQGRQIVSADWITNATTAREHYHDSWTKLTEMTLDKKVVWTYDSATMNGNKGKRVDVHAFARLPNGHTGLLSRLRLACCVPRDLNLRP